MAFRGFSKYKAQRVETDGYSFASKLEAAVYKILKLRQRAGEIKEIQVQDHVKVCGPIGHECASSEKVELVVDFKCELPDGSTLYVESKGFEVPGYRIKRRLWVHSKVGKLEVWKGSHLKPFLAETIGE